jgi:N-hydroxyarylamine O-acetyltransferase
MIDLEAYLHRIGVADDLRPDLASLEALHLAHLEAIPFENVDVRLGRPIRLDPESIHEKLIARRRGGYCFEQNTLFARALGALGFQVDTLEARVRPRDRTGPYPRTHMTLRVSMESRDYLADVGFGAFGPLLPVPLDGTVSCQPDGEYTICREEEDVWVLRCRTDEAWHDQYAFTLTPALPVDFEVANHFTSTFPASPFVNTLTVQLSTASGRHVLRGRHYSVRTGKDVTEREISADELTTLLRETFRLDIPDEVALGAFADQ